MSGGKFYEFQFDILSGATGLSASKPISADQNGSVLSALTIVGIITPPVWITAALSFRTSRSPMSVDDASAVWSDVLDQYDADYQRTPPIARSVLLTIPAGILSAVSRLQLRSGTATAAVNQTATRTFYVIARAYS